MSKALVPGLPVFFYHPQDAWVYGEISGVGAKSLIVMSVDNGEEIEHSVKEGQIHPLTTGNTLELLDDMLKLPELHESTLLHNIRGRYAQNQVYTYVGPIVIAVNPFKRLPLYGEDIIHQYRKRGLENDLPPHIFAIADASYDSLLKNNASQSVLISGESGAGKTETTKYLMKYLGEVAGVKRLTEGNIQNRIMQANPILEAFGNAKTLRNNNSSRFGKFIKIQFDQSGFLTGAQITNYLLERSRVSKQAIGERNYHVFYQLLSGASAELREQLRLQAADSFHYLRQSGERTEGNFVEQEGTYDLGDNDEDESKNFRDLLEAFSIVGLESAEVRSILRVVAGILHLGNVNFLLDETKTWHTATVSNRPILSLAADLFGVDTKKMEFNLVNRRNMIKGEYFVVALDMQQSCDNRDSEEYVGLSKALYGATFNWLVDRINQSLESEDPQLFIGLLDIFGFEAFKFCINFANEKLQQHYNRHTFKWEQEACLAEEIDYTKIDFVDNQVCLDLIEKKPLGIISLLDEESNFPKATNQTLLQKLITNHTTHSYFEKPKLSQSAFVVKHYAGGVSYEVAGFLEKNKDSLADDLVDLIQTSNVPFIANLLSRGGKKESKKKTTVGSEFRNQLDDLMKLINSTEPHWIRCIKPNAAKKPDVLTGPEVLSQLNCAGVLETIRIRRSGYPIRIPVDVFYKRFRIVFPKIKVSDGKSVRSAVAAILEELSLDSKDCQLGLTKVFLRSEQYTKLEVMRSEKLHIPAGTIQRVVRGWLGRMLAKKTRAALKMQRCVRGFLAKKRYERKKKSVIMAQSIIRMRVQRVKYSSMKLMAKEAAEIKRQIDAEEQVSKGREEKKEKKGQMMRSEAEALADIPSPTVSRRDFGITPSPVDPNLGMLMVLAALTGLSDTAGISLDKLTAMENTLTTALSHIRTLKNELIQKSGGRFRSNSSARAAPKAVGASDTQTTLSFAAQTKESSVNEREVPPQPKRETETSEEKKDEASPPIRGDDAPQHKKDVPPPPPESDDVPPPPPHKVDDVPPPPMSDDVPPMDDVPPPPPHVADDVPPPPPHHSDPNEAIDWNPFEQSLLMNNWWL
ncbi:class VII unconventional myosin [Planoprotostelium fungivorum]|uniref:Class VII unconventional myosin n=1 Tax=Planoprotostelium fungivorum TaxID=1890364 RepID=A0A2P6N3Q7_9EUKA|nr:class VII unconventional myosin [Planoprotostelium fungivorum]